MMSKKSPQLRFEGFTDDWEERKLKDYVGPVISDGDWIEKEHIHDSGVYRIIQTGNLGLGEFHDKSSSAKYMNEESFNILNANEIFPNDILISRLADPAGRTIILPDTKNKMVTAVDVTIIRPNKLFDSYFFITEMNSTVVLNKISKSVSGTSHKRISRRNLELISLLIPSLEEQQKIGTFFKQLDDIIALHQRKLDLLKEQKKGYLQKMFPKNGEKVPELRFAGFADDWEERKLIEVADYRNGKAHEKDISESGDYIVVNSKFVSTNGLVKKYSDEMIAPLSKNEIAFVLSDVPNGRAIARTFLISEENKYSLNQRIAGITPHADTNSYFLHSLMNRNHYFLRFDDGVSQTNLSKKEVEKWVELYPSYGEQQKIGSFFKQLDETIALHQRKLDLLKEQKKGYLQKMFV